MASRNAGQTSAATPKSAAPEGPLRPAEPRSFLEPVSVDIDASKVDAATALAAFLAWTGLTGWVWSIRGIAVTAREGVERIEESRATEKLAYDLRLSALESIGSDIKAIKQGQADSQTYNAQQFTDLRREIEHVRGNARDLANRGRGSRGNDS
jgi:hypothetical protein